MWMKFDRRLAVIAAAVVAVGAGGVGIARAVSGSEEPVTGPEADKAAAAALEAAGGGSVLEIERQDGDDAGFYEVEVRREDGSQVEVHLTAQFEPIGSAADDDSDNEPEDGGAEGADD
jgi:Peptidase propeptide and YPEB domain